MKSFKVNKSTGNSNNTSNIDGGVHSAVFIQVAYVGLQRPFNEGDEPDPTLAVVFELKDGEQVAKRMRQSTHPLSDCYSLFASALPGLVEADDDTWELPALLGKSALIEVEVRDGKWPKVVAIMTMEEGFEPVTPSSELLAFDADEMDKAIYLKLHRAIRSWVSKRIRHS